MPPIAFNCPICGVSLQASSKYAGRPKSCPECNANLRVPTFVPSEVPIATSVKRPVSAWRGWQNWYAIPILLVAGLIAWATGYWAGSEATAPLVAPGKAKVVATPEKPKILPQPARRDEEGLGISRHHIIDTLFQQLGARFEDTSMLPVTEQFSAEIGGIKVYLYGPEQNLKAVTVVGFFEGDDFRKTLFVLQETMKVVTPNWPAEKSFVWLGEAAESSDIDTIVSTRQGDIRITVVTSASSTPGGPDIRTICFTYR